MDLYFPNSLRSHQVFILINSDQDSSKQRFWFCSFLSSMGSSGLNTNAVDLEAMYVANIQVLLTLFRCAITVLKFCIP